MKSQRVRGAEGEDPMEFGMQDPLSSWVHKSTQSCAGRVFMEILLCRRG